MSLLIDDRELSIARYPPVCATCKHLQSRRRCAAFGDKEIPLDIWNGENKHREPYPGDNGIQYEPIKEATQ